MLSEQQLEELWAIEQIRKKLHIYIRGVDRRDRGLLYSVFHDDSTIDNGAYFQGTGYEFIEDAIEKTTPMYLSTFHQSSSHMINVDGNRAASETYVLAAFRFLSEDGKLMQQNSRGRYIDQWECRQGDWKILKRKFAQDFSDTVEVTDDGDQFYSTRDLNDPSFEVLRLT